MRRLLQHALAGVGFSALAVGATVAGITGPAVGSTTTAVPAPVVSVSTGTDSVDLPSAAVQAERAARQAAANRSAVRDRLTANAITQASRRSNALQVQSRSITREQAKIAAHRKAQAAARKARAKAEAAAKKAAAKKAERARKARIAAQGYSPGTADPRQIAKQIMQNKFGYGSDQFSCFNNIIIRESNWDIHATNASSGAYGIPQALPGIKMASVASDWRTNPATQIIWGAQYMKSRYGSPCSAWGFKSSHGWY
jgi:hypothetical protein